MTDGDTVTVPAPGQPARAASPMLRPLGSRSTPRGAEGVGRPARTPSASLSGAIAAMQEVVSLAEGGSGPAPSGPPAVLTDRPFGLNSAGSGSGHDLLPPELRRMLSTDAGRAQLGALLSQLQVLPPGVSLAAPSSSSGTGGAASGSSPSSALRSPSSQGLSRVDTIGPEPSGPSSRSSEGPPQPLVDASSVSFGARLQHYRQWPVLMPQRVYSRQQQQPLGSPLSFSASQQQQQEGGAVGVHSHEGGAPPLFAGQAVSASAACVNPSFRSAEDATGMPCRASPSGSTSGSLAGPAAHADVASVPARRRPPLPFKKALSDDSDDDEGGGTSRHVGSAGVAGSRRPPLPRPMPLQLLLSGSSRPPLSSYSGSGGSGSSTGSPPGPPYGAPALPRPGSAIAMVRAPPPPQAEPPQPEPVTETRDDVGVSPEPQRYSDGAGVGGGNSLSTPSTAPYGAYGSPALSFDGTRRTPPPSGASATSRLTYPEDHAYAPGSAASGAPHMQQQARDEEGADGYSRRRNHSASPPPTAGSMQGSAAVRRSPAHRSPTGREASRGADRLARSVSFSPQAMAPRPSGASSGPQRGGKFPAAQAPSGHLPPRLAVTPAAPRGCAGGSATGVVAASNAHVHRSGAAIYADDAFGASSALPDLRSAGTTGSAAAPASSFNDSHTRSGGPASAATRRAAGIATASQRKREIDAGLSSAPRRQDNAGAVPTTVRDQVMAPAMDGDAQPDTDAAVRRTFSEDDDSESDVDATRSTEKRQYSPLPAAAGEASLGTGPATVSTNGAASDAASDVEVTGIDTSHLGLRKLKSGPSAFTSKAVGTNNAGDQGSLAADTKPVKPLAPWQIKAQQQQKAKEASLNVVPATGAADAPGATVDASLHLESESAPVPTPATVTQPTDAAIRAQLLQTAAPLTMTVDLDDFDLTAPDNVLDFTAPGGAADASFVGERTRLAGASASVTSGAVIIDPVRSHVSLSELPRSPQRPTAQPQPRFRGQAPAPPSAAKRVPATLQGKPLPPAHKSADLWAAALSRASPIPSQQPPPGNARARREPVSYDGVLKGSATRVHMEVL